MQDGEVRKAFQRSLTKQGFKFKLGIKVQSAKTDGKTVTLETESVKGGKQETMEADIVLVSAGPPSSSLASNFKLSEPGLSLSLQVPPPSPIPHPPHTPPFLPSIKSQTFRAGVVLVSPGPPSAFELTVIAKTLD
jgi:hypothetical protein